MKHPYGNNISNLDELMGVFDKRMPQLAYMDKPGAIGAEFDKHAKVGDADDQGREHGSGLKPIHRWNIASKWNWVLKITTIGKGELQGSGNRQ
jgi:hypothetical protein